MNSNKQYRRTDPGLPDLLNWAAVIDDGIVINKDGSLLAGYFYQGKDLSVATVTEQNQTSAFLNSALSKLGSEWCLHQDAIRVSSREYPKPEENHFPDTVSRLIDNERRGTYQQGNHYESMYALTLTWLPDRQAASQLADMMFEDEGGGKVVREKAGTRALVFFKQALQEFEDQVSVVLKLTRMQAVTYVDESGEHTNDQLLQYLHYCLTGLSHPINLPPCPMYLDAVIGGHEFTTGIIPRIEDSLIQVIAIDGFPQESYPGILSALDQIPMRYRWSTRFLFQDAVDAEKSLEAFRKKWEQKIRGFWDQVFYSRQTSTGRVNQDAVRMAAEAEDAMSEASSGLVTYGYYTSTIIILGDDIEVLQEQARAARKLINNLGFAARIETINTVEAWLGSLPGHVVPNLRRPVLHTLHLADLLPLSSVWAGREYAPSDFYPPKSPPLLLATTEGSTPFRLNLHVGDLGHTLMLGPTGAGKSTALALIAAQFLRYRDATVFAFDKGNSMETLTLGVGGSHFNIGGNSDDSDLCFSPLQNIDDPDELAWAEDWVGTLIELQGQPLSPVLRNEIHRALLAIRDSSEPRTLTALQITLQEKVLKDSLEEYTVSGALGELLDAESDGLSMGNWSCFELETLMHRDDRVRLPVLLYLFHVIEKTMIGQPCLLILDEAWLMLSHPTFKEKIREWLKVLRKANCAVVMATQSLSDAVNSGILDVLVESCPTKIFLANREAKSDENAELYRAMGCNQAEISIISNMVPKREYFVIGEGKRRVNFSIGPVALSFVGVSSKPDLKEVRQLRATVGADWPYQWLHSKGVRYESYL